MKRLFLRWALLAFSVFATALICQALQLGFKVQTSSFMGVVNLFVGVGILAFLNATIGRVLKALTLPLTCLTLGLFSLVVNAVVLYGAATLKLGFAFVGSPLNQAVSAFVASILISVINGVLGVFLPSDGKDD